MSTFVVYQLDNGDEILVELSSSDGSIIPTSTGSVLIKAKKTFSEALKHVKSSATALRKELEALRAEEVEVKFGLKTTGEAGNTVFAISKVGIEANYEVTLKWINPPKKKSIRRKEQKL